MPADDDVDGSIAPSQAANAAGGLRVEDARQLRRRLEAALAAPAARDAFMAGLAAVAADERLFRRALLPMTAAGGGAHGGASAAASAANGDSLVRVALNTARVQPRVAALLLEKLPEYCGDADDDGHGHGHGAGATDTSTPSLILGQLRWLEAVADAAGLTDKVLEVLPVCPPRVQQQLVGFLPEVASPEEHGRVLDALLALLEADAGFAAAALDALGDLQLEGAPRLRALEALEAQLPAVAADDLPALVRFLAAGAPPSAAPAVAAALRAALPCAAPSDPRLAVPDSKQKGPAGGRGRAVPEARVARELGQALQASDAAAAGFLKAIAEITEPRAHRPLDFWVLVMIWQRGGMPAAAGGGGGGGTGGGGGGFGGGGFGGAGGGGGFGGGGASAAAVQARAAEALLRRKLSEGHAGGRWIDASVVGHEAVVLDLWQPLCGLAAAWARAKEAPARAAAARLYRALFVGAGGGAQRQEVLQALHGHLGSGQAREEDCALDALLALARRHAGALAQYGAYLASALDHLEAFSDAQLARLFEAFAALTAPAAAARAAAAAAEAAGGGGGGGGGGSSGAAWQGGRFEDELHITLAKALAHTR